MARGIAADAGVDAERAKGNVETGLIETAGKPASGGGPIHGSTGFGETHRIRNRYERKCDDSVPPKRILGL